MKLSPARVVAASCLVPSLFASRAAVAQEPVPARPAEAPETTTAPAFEKPVPPAAIGAYPRVGGHLGFALPIVSVSTATTVIGSDFVAVGLTPGITVKLSERWSVDFEFIARNELKNTPAATTWVVDPGVIYSGGSVSGGLRIASQVGAKTNAGLVPIIVLPVVKLSDTVDYYIEGDVPFFVFDGGTKVNASIGFQFQSGFSF